MGHARFLVVVAAVSVLAACGGFHSLKAGTDPNGSAFALAGHNLSGHAPSKTAPVAAAKAAFRDVANTNSGSSGDKLIALTFDDGPRPYVLFGSKERPAPGLAEILDKNGVKATFFVVGWRLTPKTWGEKRHEENIGMTCLEAAEQLLKHGHELEDHTYSHIELRTAERKNGEKWVMGDVDRGAEAIKAVTGAQPRYVRPPDWIITSDARQDLLQHGYRVLSISPENPMALRDVNSLDYLCAGKAVGCPRPSLGEAVMKQIEWREKKGTFTHILAFHELSTTAAVMPRLINDLKARGYRFVTLTEYMRLVGGKDEPVKRAAVGHERIEVNR
jgi:peptidoglycan/xylan/chitin deacetylase (PgdA/CDA1 family)